MIHHLWIFIISGLLCLSVAASETFIPNHLFCVSESKELNVQEFTLRKINTLSPTISYQGEWIESSLSGDSLALNFRYGTEGILKVQFLKEDLRHLKLAEVSFINGLMEINSEQFNIRCESTH